MFEGFSHVWTAATSRRLRGDKPLPVTVAGERLVFFRDAQGKARALVDRCPHRGVQLSLGKVKAGCLECPFHGWHFDGEGKACSVPYNPDAKLDALRATAIPCEERGGVLYIYTAPADEVTPPPLTLPDALEATTLTRVVLEVEWKTHWTRAMENMLDWPHLPFVHNGTIGRELRKGLEGRTRMDVDVDELPTGVASRIRVDGNAQPGGLDWHKPNLMVLHIDPPGTIFKMHVACVPVDDATTRMIVVSARSFLKARVLNPLFVVSNRKIVGEDRAVVESSSPAEIPFGAAEVSVRTDKLPLIFRKYYHEVLKPSSAGPMSRGSLKVLSA